MSVQSGSCQVRYLFNSGFVVETESHMFVFDVCEPSEFVNDELLSRKRVTFFVTHNHSDHFDTLIYQWANKPDVQYVIHRDVDSPKDAKFLFVEADEQHRLDNMSVYTLGSTDRGVSFLVEVDGLRFFHSGDLNWWKWKNDSTDVQNKEEFAYKAEVQKLSNTDLDIAFIPVDPRLGEYYDLAVKYFAETISVNTIIPMHFRDAVKPIEDLGKAWQGLNYASNFVTLIKSGESFNYKK